MDDERARLSPKRIELTFRDFPKGRAMPRVNALRCLILLFIITLPGEATAQAPPSPSAAIYPGRCETRVSERTGDAGCYWLTTEPMDGLSEAVYWHLYTYPTLAIAQAARSRNGVAVQSLGKFWVFTIADQQWKPANGERVAVIGPLHLERGARYSARYMESILPPEVRGSTGHSHSGPEAFYVLSGAQCLETPDGTTVTTAGASVIMHSGHPMALNGVGAENRKAVFIVLHDSAQPWITRGGTWTPPDRCSR